MIYSYHIQPMKLKK